MFIGLGVLSNNSGATLKPPNGVFYLGGDCFFECLCKNRCVAHLLVYLFLAFSPTWLSSLNLLLL